MSGKTTKTLAATALAALGLSNLSPAQWVAAGAVLSTAAVATSALATTQIPGVGLIIKRKPGNAPIIAPTDANGVVRLTGLEPGEYMISLIGDDQANTVQVGANGILTVRAVTEDDGSNRRVEAIISGGKPHDWCKPLSELCPYLKTALASAAPFNVKALFVSEHLLIALPRRQQLRPVDPVAPNMRFIDVNASSADDIVRLAPATSPEAAQFIVAERAKAGAFKDVIDFAQRVCPSVSVDFAFAPTRIGNALIVTRASKPPKDAGFKCEAQRAGAAPVLYIYAVSYGYVGHVTLLR